MLNSLTECRDSARMLESYRDEGRERQFYDELTTLLEAGEVDVRRLSIRRLYETFCEFNGERNELEAHRYLEDRRHGRREVTLLEAGGNAVSTAAFANIFGQIQFSRVMDQLQSPKFIGDRLMTTVPAETQSVEMRPGVSMLGDSASDVGENEEYPEVGLNEDYIVIEQKIKDGFIVSVTDETIWEDKTGQVLRMANDGARAMGITMEKEKLDTALGLTDRYQRKNGSKQATYGNTHTEGDFDNLRGTNTLTDYTDIENALLLFDAITDPNTGEPVVLIGPMQLVVPTKLNMTASNILNAVQLKIGADSGSVQQMVPNPLNVADAGAPRIELVSTAYVKQRTNSDSTYFIGDFKRAFEYVEVWPVQTFVQQGQSSESGFKSDVVARYKTRRKGVPAVVEPRYVVKCTT